MPLPEDEASWGDAARDVRHGARRRAAQRAQRLRQRQPDRQDRHEVRGRGRRRPADRRQRLQRGAGRAAGDPPAAAPSASRSATVRVFQSRASTGVRGIALAEGDEVISMSLFDSGKGITTEERDAYLRQSRAARQAENAELRERRGRDDAGGGGDGGCRDAVGRALRRAAGQGGVRAHRRRVGLRQAHLGLRVSRHRPRRQGRRADEPGREAARSWRRSRCWTATRSCW